MCVIRSVINFAEQVVSVYLKEYCKLMANIIQKQWLNISLLMHHGFSLVCGQ